MGDWVLTDWMPSVSLLYFICRVEISARAMQFARSREENLAVESRLLSQSLNLSGLSLNNGSHRRVAACKAACYVHAKTNDGFMPHT